MSILIGLSINEHFRLVTGDIIGRKLIESKPLLEQLRIHTYTLLLMRLYNNEWRIEVPWSNDLKVLRLKYYFADRMVFLEHWCLLLYLNNILSKLIISTNVNKENFHCISWTILIYLSLKLEPIFSLLYLNKLLRS